MKVMIVSFSFQRGGAGHAARSFARLAAGFAEVRCISAERSAIASIGLEMPSAIESYAHLVKRVGSLALSKLMRDGNPVKHSLNLFSARNVLTAIRQVDAETVVNLHWINNETLSIRELGRLPSGTVLTLHDEWFFLGTEHCQYPARAGVTNYGYQEPAPGTSVVGVNWNEYIWRIKRRQIEKRGDLIFTAPSHWMVERAKQSQMLRDKDVRLVPNPIDTVCFRPVDRYERAALRKKMGLADGEFALTFGAMGGQRDPLKGFEFLRGALERLKSEVEPSLLERVRLVVFGGGISSLPASPFRVLEVGRIDSRTEMSELYALSDCVVVPSLVESFGQVAAESLACGTPVVAFRASGLVDIVQDGVSGCLAEPFRSESLAACIARMLRMSPPERASLGDAGREHVVKCFSPEKVRGTYQTVLEEGLRRRTKRKCRAA